MSWVLVVDDKIVEVRSPRSTGEHKLSDGLLVRPGVNGWTEKLAAVCGFFRVVGDPPVANDGEVVERDPVPVLVDGVPTWQYTVRAKTVEELAAEAEAEADRAERDQVKQAVTNLRAYENAASPTNAQTVAVVKLLCRVAIRLIRDQYGR